MFTGLIHHLGTVKALIRHELGGGYLVIEGSLPNYYVGESIAVNGVCLTLLPESDKHEFKFDLSSETLNITQLKELKLGDLVHLEQALCLSDRMGGHMVTGHVDATLSLKARYAHNDCMEMIFDGVQTAHRPFLVPKGCIALAGVSLTIHAVGANEISVMLVPHTLQQTLFNNMRIGQIINVEYDYFAKLIAEHLKNFKPKD